MTYLFKLALAFCAVSASTPALAHGNIGSAGAGIGASYGMIGGSFDVKIVERIYASAGLGFAGDELGYNVGLRAYLVDDSKVWRPRLVANYGTNGLISTQVCFFDTCTDEEYESFQGVSIGLGQSVAFGRGEKRHGFELDFLYNVDDGGRGDRIDELEDSGFELEGNKNKFFLSAGYRFSF